MHLFAEIKNDYVTGSESYKALAKKYSADYSEILLTAREEGWAEQRREFRNSAQYCEKRLEEVTLKLIRKLERAIDELDSYVTTVHIKEKNTEYDEEGKKAVFERVVESEEICIKKGLIDRTAIKQLAATIKELKGRDMQEEEAEGVEVILSDEARELAK
ncbi:MAG: hypothetical protein E7591_01130 [Ruminococcaceae bacterium]|nr:hypothetical protein [Oscillospiraceae bacterium]